MLDLYVWVLWLPIDGQTVSLVKDNNASNIPLIVKTGASSIWQNAHNFVPQSRSFHAFLMGHTLTQFSRSPPLGSPTYQGEKDVTDSPVEAEVKLPSSWASQ